MHYIKGAALIGVIIAVLFSVMAIFAILWPILIVVGLIFVAGQIIKAMDKENKGL